ncbi:unnamed protein product [Eruca vesicaria subsp. sativa]|uniref:Uncharacterized protein n=1 Tax=Eruca vesicaria subsp. sativa TaxID=29727 RepID=A0ABC8IVX4_ERUVS|nr:unnamed protein product [Eruca vesicaria subsp. sativa]
MKKPSMISALITLILAAAVCTTYGEPVKDTAGNPVRVGEKYFITPVNTGGGLVPHHHSNFPFCPLGIAVIPYPPGLAVSFTYPFSLPVIVATSSFVNIEFRSDNWPDCNEFSKFWQVDNTSSSSKEPAIIIGAENRGFKIEKAGEEAGENTYKLTTLTGTVGAIPRTSIREAQLVLTNDDAKTLLVQFNKFHDATTVTTSTSPVEKLLPKMFPFY